jgi:hypothetical protein
MSNIAEGTPPTWIIFSSAMVTTAQDLEVSRSGFSATSRINHTGQTLLQKRNKIWQAENLICDLERFGATSSADARTMETAQMEVIVQCIKGKWGAKRNLPVS